MASSVERQRHIGKMSSESFDPGRRVVLLALLIALQLFDGEKVDTRYPVACAFTVGFIRNQRTRGASSSSRERRFIPAPLLQPSTNGFTTTTIAVANKVGLVDDESLSSSLYYNRMDVLQHLVSASSLSYLPLTSSDGSDAARTMESSPYYCSNKLEPLAQMVGRKTQSGATIFRSTIDPTKTTIVVACRGSATPINFSTNLRFKLVPLCSTDDSSSTFLVHEGFQESSNELWELIADKLEKILDEETKDGRPISLVFTGHSLGAANALLCAAKYQQSFADRAPLSAVLTFGGPRLVNRALSDDWNQSLFSSPVVRNYVHWRDPILRQNGPLWDSLGFGILGTEILCEHDRAIAYHDRDSAPYDEPNLPLAWNILDHCSYLGIFVGPRLF